LEDCLRWCEFYGLEVRSKAEHGIALDAASTTAVAAGRLTGMLGKEGIDEEKAWLVGVEGDKFLMSGTKEFKLTEPEMEEVQQLKKQGYWVVEPRRMHTVDLKRTGRSNSDIVTGQGGLKSEAGALASLHAGEDSGEAESTRSKELEANKKKVEERIAPKPEF